MDRRGSPFAPSEKTGVASHEDTLDEHSGLQSRCEGLDISGRALPSSEGVAECIEAMVLNVEEVNTFSCMYQVHLTQHACVWDGIARVNEEILLTMLDIFEKHESKSVHVNVCLTFFFLASSSERGLFSALAAFRNVLYQSAYIPTRFTSCASVCVSLVVIVKQLLIQPAKSPHLQHTLRVYF